MHVHDVTPCDFAALVVLLAIGAYQPVCLYHCGQHGSSLPASKHEIKLRSVRNYGKCSVSMLEDSWHIRS